MQPVNKQNKISSTTTGVKTFKNVCHGGPDINQAVQPCGLSLPGACSATYLCRAVKFCSAYTLLVMLLSGPMSVGSAVPLSVWLSAPLLGLSQGFWSDLCLSRAYRLISTWSRTSATPTFGTRLWKNLEFSWHSSIHRHPECVWWGHIYLTFILVSWVVFQPIHEEYVVWQFNQGAQPAPSCWEWEKSFVSAQEVPVG